MNKSKTTSMLFTLLAGIAMFLISATVFAEVPDASEAQSWSGDREWDDRGTYRDHRTRIRRPR